MDAIRLTSPAPRDSLSWDIKFHAAAAIDIPRDSLGAERASLTRSLQASWMAETGAESGSPLSREEVAHIEHKRGFLTPFGQNARTAPLAEMYCSGSQL
jgi:hypothetical protein